MLRAGGVGLLAVLIFVAMRYGLAAGDKLGKWQDDDGANYEFLENNQFRFTGFEKVWLEHRGFAPNPFANLPRSREPRGQYIQERRELSGAWEAGERICTATVADIGEVSGNLKIYAGKIECCMEAKRLGPTLVLRALTSAAPPKGKEGAPEICVNRALRQSSAQSQ